ncbi:hypothetical protein MRX96_008263 [Rhipicephalus microplus]
MSDFLKVGYLAPFSPSRPPALISNSSSRISRVRDATRTAPIHRAETRSAKGRPSARNHTRKKRTGERKKFPEKRQRRRAHLGWETTAGETPRNPTELMTVTRDTSTLVRGILLSAGRDAITAVLASAKSAARLKRRVRAPRRSCRTSLLLLLSNALLSSSLSASLLLGVRARGFSCSRGHFLPGPVARCP